MAGTEQELSAGQKHRLALETKRLMGKLCVLMSEKRNRMTPAKARLILNDIYNETDNLVLLIDEMEKEVDKWER